MSVLTSISLGIFIALSDGAGLVATETIRAGDVLTPANTSSGSGSPAPEEHDLLGREVRRTVYSGQAISVDNTQTPRLVARNQLVTVKYIDGPLEIMISGRAMGAAAEGEAVDVMNQQSRQMIRGVVTKDGWVLAQ